MSGLKISDTDQGITVGSRADLYWQSNEIGEFYKYLRPKLQLPGTLVKLNRIETVLDYFKIQSVGFGNWVTVEDRINYINAMVIAFYDLNKVLRFNRNIGINKNLSITFGARGFGGAMAHYENSGRIINITRYSDGSSPKVVRFLTSGGVTAFAHEYGHFLDYFFGTHVEPYKGSIALTNGRSIATKPTGINSPMRIITDKILFSIMFNKSGREHSAYYKRLKQFVDRTQGYGDYFIRRNEIFARAFEVYVMFELKQMGITNKFLTASKYSSMYNLKESEIKPLVPLFRELLRHMRRYI